jgi:hypothetical protein
MRRDDPVFERSETELRFIAEWYVPHHRRDERPISLLLVGGWAVWCYNPYYPSIDIDIVSSNKLRQSLFNVLHKKRAFDRVPSIERNITAFMLPFEGKEIIIDYDGLNNPGDFKGRDEKLPWSHAIDNHKIHQIGAGFLPIPERGILLLHKLKAIVDRSWDLEHERKNKIYLTGKLAKDRADVLSLVDPARGGKEIDIGSMGRILSGLPFLIPVLQDVPGHSESYERYGCDRTEANEWVDRLVSLVTHD